MANFKELRIDSHILKAIEDAGFTEPTEIQEKSIPVILEGKDIIAGSATGSGKTLAFGIGIIQKAVRGKGIQALVMTPTRELAEQVAKELYKFSRNSRLEIETVYGGVSIGPQIDHLKTADVVVGTPGRILDHLQRCTINLQMIKLLVIDEADRMLDMGFIDDIKRIISQCSRERQTLLFSATIEPEISRLANKYMRSPVMISGEKQVDPSKLKQVYYDVSEKMKFSLLVHLLKHENAKLVMIFCNSRKTVDFIANNLQANGIKSQPIHAGFSQNIRSKVMTQFHSQQVNVLVCTDVAGRGLDIKEVSHVYNYDAPRDSKQYIHRIGRTARAGSDGKAINLVSDRDYDNFDKVMRSNQITIPKEKTPQFQVANISWFERKFERKFDRKPKGNFRRTRR